MTIHSWGMIAPGNFSVDKQVRRIKTCKPAYKRWKDTKVLIIDESKVPQNFLCFNTHAFTVSMVDGNTFNILAKVAGQLRSNKRTNKPFGGIQVSPFSYLAQCVSQHDLSLSSQETSSSYLPLQNPGNSHSSHSKARHGRRASMKLSISLRSTDRKILVSFSIKTYLTRIEVRVDLIQLLNELRRGSISPSALETFTSLSRNLSPLPSGILPTELYPLRAQVERANAQRLSSLHGPAFPYVARDSGSHLPLLESIVVPVRLSFKEDAQVMLVKNVDQHLVNGTVGRVLGFYTISQCLASINITYPNPPSSAAQHSTDTSLKSSTHTSVLAGDSQSITSSTVPKMQGTIRHIQLCSDGRTPIALSPKDSFSQASSSGVLPPPKSIP